MKYQNPPIKCFRDLVAWQRSYALARRVYDATRTFPADERFGLVQQLRRAVVSIASNVAEGYGRGGRADYARFLKLARGSLYEVDTQLELSHDLGYLADLAHEEIQSELDQCERVLAGLIRSLEVPADGAPTPR